MVFKHLSYIKNLNKGITLVEIVIVVFIVALFSTILIANFPQIQKQLALSRATYELAQNLRRTLDLGLSGVQATDKNGTPIAVKGYGVYVNLSDPARYVIYADVGDTPDYKYDGDTSYTFCDSIDQAGLSGGKLTSDCIIDRIDLFKEGGTLYIKSLQNIDPAHNFTSINFNPPNPTVTLNNLYPIDSTEVGIELTNGTSSRWVCVNKSGLINIKNSICQP